MATFSVSSFPSPDQSARSVDDAKTASHRAPVPFFVRCALRAASERVQNLIEEQYAGRSLPRDAETMLTLETEIHSIFAQCADVFVHRTVEMAHLHSDWIGDSLTLAFTGPFSYLEGDRTVSVRFQGGSVLPVRTPYVLDRDRCRPRRARSRGRQGNGRYPVLRQLGIVDRASPGLISTIGVRVAATSIEEAREDLARRGLHFNVKTIRRLALRLGDCALQARERRLSEAMAGKLISTALADKRVVISLDGGRIKFRAGSKKGRRRKNGHRGYHTEWREPKVLAVYTIDTRGKKVRNGFTLLDATMGDCDEVFRLLLGYLKCFGAQAASQLVVTGDGALWIWDRIDALIEQLGIPRQRVSEVVDFYHATERLGDIADQRDRWSEGERERWLGRARTRLWNGDIDGVLGLCRPLCRGRYARSITKLLDYYDRNRHRMTYAAFRRMRIPAGSGIVESAIRRIVNLRLKGPGIFWTPRSAEAVLHLRAALKSGRWHELVVSALTSTPQFTETPTQTEFPRAM